MNPNQNNTDLSTQNEDEEQPTKAASIVQRNSALVASEHRVVSFRGRAMILEEHPYRHFVPLHKEKFKQIAYPLLGGVTRSRISDVFEYVANTAVDLSENDRYVLFGVGTDSQQVWDMVELQFVTHIEPEMAVWRSPFPAIKAQDPLLHAPQPVPFVMSLAGGDGGLYDDIMQSLAPLLMEKKPDGVIWWVGDGANGKSTLMDAIYQIFPGQLSSITVKRLTDGRDTPSLNGTLANVVKESSEGRIEDTEIYKAIGTHEDFRVHKFHSQDDIAIRGNLHHIFSANNIPAFNDKGWSARRRTYVVPFMQRFDSDPTFEERTFSTEMFGRLIAEMCRYAVRIEQQGYRYKWSQATTSAKLDYDTDANNAEEYAKHLIAIGVVAFDSFNPLKMDYENWCSDNGYVPLGVQNMRRAVQSSGFERIAARNDPGGGVGSQYRLTHIDNKDLIPFGMGRPGMYTVEGFVPMAPVEVPIPEFRDDPAPAPEAPVKKSILNNRW